MSKYMIHCVPERVWYVKQYLIPKMIEQQIKRKDITIYVDEGRLGNLKSCLQSFAAVGKKGKGGTWHLQDDVVISSRFGAATAASTQEQQYVICGYTYSGAANATQDGNKLVTPDYMWFSFPCIYIPNRLAAQFVEWCHSMEQATDDGGNKSKYKSYINTGKNDDLLFYHFLKKEYPHHKIKLLNPNIVQHIDYLIGGSVANQWRTNIQSSSAKYFDQPQRVEELKRWLWHERNG